MTIKLSVIPTGLTAAVLDKEIPIEGAEFEMIKAQSVDRNSRAMLRLEFDIGEMSFATFLKSREDGLPLIGLPLFTGRRFSHPCISFFRGAGISGLSDLKGKRVGVPQYWLTSSVWHRSLLAEYGVAPQSIDWVTTTPERSASLRFPDGVQVRQVDTDLQGLQAMLRAGEIDAILSPRPARAAEPDGPVSLPFADIVHAQHDYFRRTAIFPIMHFLVMKQAIAAQHPALAGAVIAAFGEAKQKALAGAAAVPLESPIHGETIEQARAFFGDDPWPYGVEQNERVLDYFLASAVEQGLVKRRFEARELFVDAAGT
jgi:4,5-dihydroxyphthalate decarboxylase